MANWAGSDALPAQSVYIPCSGHGARTLPAGMKKHVRIK
jgi:hypothetical protein